MITQQTRIDIVVKREENDIVQLNDYVYAIE